MDSDEVIDQIAQQLIRLGKLRERTQAQIAAMSGGEIEVAAYGIIFRLLCDGPMRSGALAEALYSDASTISRQVAHLVKRGLIERRADPADGRASVLVVTDAGREVAAEIRKRRNETLARVMTDWTDDERALLGSLLRRFVDDYEAARPAILTPPTSRTAAMENDS
ncbi:MarR family transcriptional regulator [Nocardia sp. CDC159]|uniref:MarR family transcriptional regulator n=1 Tax=Nocardia pulmonis TaxID=2951408 RepID=A0A9X2IX68_9NOCA|nr:MULTISPECIES: MarR family transcriptional regulator [Nocardia]MCM6775702.1 MarR family transcriptional regulator [Nocardia pulmonis]MCM6788322.1 MarR family transcriptional regulator [Nocardia sp. CDC159]